MYYSSLILFIQNLAVMNGNEVVKVFKELTDIRTFEELDIPLTTVATDIIR